VGAEFTNLEYVLKRFTAVGVDAEIVHSLGFWMGAEFTNQGGVLSMLWFTSRGRLEGGRHTLAGVLLGDIPLPHHPWSLQLLFVLAASSSTPS